MSGFIRILSAKSGRQTKKLQKALQLNSKIRISAAIANEGKKLEVSHSFHDSIKLV